MQRKGNAKVNIKIDDKLEEDNLLNEGSAIHCTRKALVVYPHHCCIGSCPADDRYQWADSMGGPVCFMSGWCQFRER